MGRRILVVILIVAASGAAGWYWWHLPRPNLLEWQGYADADFIKVGPTQQGLLTIVHVRRGEHVAAGAPLFDQDDVQDHAARDQAERQLAQAEQQLQNLQAPGKPTEIQQAEANLRDAQAARDKIQADLERSERLVKVGAATVQLVDQQRKDMSSNEAKVHAAEAALAQMRAPMGREREITAQRATVEAAKAAVGMAQWRLDQRHVSAPASGVIADVLARPGETMPAGGPVISLLPPENIFVRFFVPEPMLSHIHLGDEVAIVCDNCPGDLRARISFISPQVEYTPPVIFSESMRSKLVVRIEARPRSEQAMLLNPGQPLSVRPIEKDAGT
jgi:HlyD family secretion protein